MTSPIVKAEGGEVALLAAMTEVAYLRCALRGCIEHMEHSTPYGRNAYESAKEVLEGIPSVDLLTVLAESEKKDARIAGLGAALDSLASQVIEVVRVPPLADCCCHLGGAPCAGCQDNANTFAERELVEAAHRALTKIEGSKPE